MAKGLSDKQRAFCREYVVDKNAMQAAIRAGYSEKGAGVQGHTLLKNLKVRAEINRLTAETVERVNITVDVVLAGIMQSVENAVAAGQNTAALKGWELLGKYLGMFTENRSLFADGELKIELKWDRGDPDD